MPLPLTTNSRNAGASDLAVSKKVQQLHSLAATAPAHRLDHARTMAEILLAHFGLIGWRFRFMSRRATRRFGDCEHRRKIIRLSPVLTEMNDMDEIEDTIRHEIAHALCDPGDGHNKRFYAMCIKVGARPERCYGPDVNRPPRKRKPDTYRRRCVACETSWPYRGQISATRACGKCGSDLINEHRGGDGWEPRSHWSAYCGYRAADQLEDENVHEDDPCLGLFTQDAFDEPVRCDYCGSHHHDWEWVRYAA